MPGGNGHGRALRSWRVLHACDDLATVAAALEAQLVAGMQPCIVLPGGAVIPAEALSLPPALLPAPASLLGAWQQVRQWRRVILETDPFGFYQVLHAHTFAAGMAGVRNWPVVVYDVRGFVEESAADPGLATPGAWLARSFRVAEQFVLSRAGAVVVHSPAVREGVVERGAAPEDVFLLPQAVLSPLALAARYDAIYRHARERRRSDSGIAMGSLRPLQVSP